MDDRRDDSPRLRRLSRSGKSDAHARLWLSGVAASRSKAPVCARRSARAVHLCRSDLEAHYGPNSRRHELRSLAFVVGPGRAIRRGVMREPISSSRVKLSAREVLDLALGALGAL